MLVWLLDRWVLGDWSFTRLMDLTCDLIILQKVKLCAIRIKAGSFYQLRTEK